jgi:hypothetical protein
LQQCADRLIQDIRSFDKIHIPFFVSKIKRSLLF